MSKPSLAEGHFSTGEKQILLAGVFGFVVGVCCFGGGGLGCVWVFCLVFGFCLGVVPPIVNL